MIFEASSQLQTLLDLKLKQVYTARNGSAGRYKNQFGSRGEDLVLKVPCGTIIWDEDEVVADLKEDGSRYVVAKGGKGGLGNSAFATSVNRAPRYAQPGLPGEERSVKLELRLIAEVGLIGLPNAGKSTLLKTLTKANPKIADYPFTTLYPNLGVLKFIDREIILADIPGLIEGASEGHGLGLDFLRHVDRTQVLVHLIGARESAEDVWHDYQIVDTELSKSQVDLSEKARLVVLSKVDIIDTPLLLSITSFFKEKGIFILGISSIRGDGIDELIRHIVKECNKAKGSSV